MDSWDAVCAALERPGQEVVVTAMVVVQPWSRAARGAGTAALALREELPPTVALFVVPAEDIPREDLRVVATPAYVLFGGQGQQKLLLQRAGMAGESELLTGPLTPEALRATLLAAVEAVDGGRRVVSVPL